MLTALYVSFGAGVRIGPIHAGRVPLVTATAPLPSVGAIVTRHPRTVVQT